MKKLSLAGILLSVFVTSAIMHSCKNSTPRPFLYPNRFAELSSVKITDGIFREAMMRTDEYLRILDPDRLLHFFRLDAGLDTIAPPYGGWEVRELRGHSIGHYLSACSKMYASTGDTILKEKAEYIIDELAKCQEATGTGYLSAFPEEFIDRVENLQEVWAPYYTLHKIMAGLYDSYVVLGNDKALDILKGMADWLYSRCMKISDEHMQKILDRTEQGGMNEVLYNLYSVTGDSRYMDLARKFYQESYFRPILSYYDSLKGQHVNSFIPNVIGLMRDYEITGNKESYRISDWFWQQVTAARSYVTGGTSNNESWNADPYHMHEELSGASHETCCTYNMLKLTGHLFLTDPDAKYMDYYENTLINGILPTQDTATNMTMYYVPMQSGYYKTFGTAFNSFWCCTGTGMENFAGTAGTMYMTGNNRLYVNLYIPSELHLENEGIRLHQETTFPEDGHVKINVQTDSSCEFGLCLRIPFWTTSEYSLKVNGKEIKEKVKPGNYIEVRRKWRKDDVVDLFLPMELKMQTLPSTHEYSVLRFGPVVMAGVLSDTSLTEDKVYNQYGPHHDKPQDNIPVMKISDDLSDCLKKDKGMLHFTGVSMTGDSVDFIPFYKLFDTRYMVYFRTDAN